MKKMTKKEMAMEIINIQNELGKKAWTFETAMKNTYAFLENKLEYLRKEVA
jgi:hypothetical protein